jgi:hypothetical protein
MEDVKEKVSAMAGTTSRSLQPAQVGVVGAKSERSMRKEEKPGI